MLGYQILDWQNFWRLIRAKPKLPFEEQKDMLLLNGLGTHQSLWRFDVYSFGVLLLEIICCRRSVDLEISGTGAILIDCAYDCYRHGTLDALIQDDMEAMNDVSTLERAMKVAIWCIQEVPSLRSTMRKVTQMLEGVVEVPAPPNPFPFSEISCSWKQQ